MHTRKMQKNSTLALFTHGRPEKRENRHRDLSAEQVSPELEIYAKRRVVCLYAGLLLAETEERNQLCSHTFGSKS